MNVKRTILILLALLTILAMTSCEMITDFIESRTRPIPVIEIFNGNLEKTLKMVPNDTLYVRVQGLARNTEHTVQVLDPVDKLITEAVVLSDENGIIGLTPLWYDIGFKISRETGRVYLDTADLSVKAFYIRVADNNESSRAVIEKTDFRLPFFFVNTNNYMDRSQPVVMAGKRVDAGSGDEFVLENVFYSEDQTLGSIDYGKLDGDPITPKEYEKFTNTLFVKIDNLEAVDDIGGKVDDEVCIWILPSKSEPFLDRERFADDAYFYQTFLVSQFDEDEDGNGGYVEIFWPTAEPTAPVDIDTADSANKQIFIPDWAEERSYSVIADVENQGQFGIYEILKADNTSYYLDGVDGNGVPGFIVKKTNPVEYATVSHIQLASNGYYEGFQTTSYWGYTYMDHWKIRDNAFVNEFKEDGSDTKWAYTRYYGYEKGVKVSWNPYSYKGYPSYYPYYSTGGDGTLLSSYVGQNVDVYVINTDANMTFAVDENIESEFVVSYRRIPVQFSCWNGSGMQTIWKAPYGEENIDESFIVVVDLNKDGKITDGDLVDDERTDTGAGGFSIIEN